MTRHSNRIALAACLFLLAGILAAKPAGKVSLSVGLEKPEYKLSDKIEIEFKLVNKGKEPVYVNKRFKLGSAKAAPDQRELIVELKSAEGNPLQMKQMDYDTGLPKSDYFQLLQPGEEASAERKWDLKDLATIEKPGTYEITATYQNAFGKELGLDVFGEKVTASAKVKVTE